MQVSTLGGGVGLASRKFGLTCDNLLEATVVLADGSAVVANAHQHPDLYWALRGGGGGNFGIVTRLVFRTHPVGQVATYSLEWPWSDAKSVVQAWQKLAPHAPDGLFSVLNLNAAAGGRAHITSAGQFFGSADKLRELLKPLANAGTPTRFTVTSRSYLDAQEMWAGCGGTLAECHLPPQGNLGRSTFKGKSSFANAPLTSAGIDTMLHQIEARISTGTGSGIILLDSYGGAINRVKKDATAFVHRDALFSMQYLAYWDAAAAAEPNLRWLKSFYAAMRPHVSPFAYQNYIDPDLPKVGSRVLRNESGPADRGQAQVRPAERLQVQPRAFRSGGAERELRGHERALARRADHEERATHCLCAIAQAEDSGPARRICTTATVVRDFETQNVVIQLDRHLRLRRLCVPCDIRECFEDDVVHRRLDVLRQPDVRDGDVDLDREFLYSRRDRGAESLLCQCSRVQAAGELAQLRQCQVELVRGPLQRGRNGLRFGLELPPGEPDRERQ